MHRSHFFAVTLAISVGISLPVLAQEKGTWRAASSTASSITGDVAISGDKISINFAAFPFSQIRALDGAELKAAFDLDGSASGTGNLYRINIPADRKFVRKNTLCGSEDVQWMVTYVSGRALQLAFFSGPKMPVFSAEAIMSSINLCGTFAYAK